MSDKSHFKNLSAMKQLLLILFIAVQLMSCQTPVQPVQDDPVLRRQIAQHVQNFALENASRSINSYQQAYPASAELPAMKAALAERYLDRIWLQLAKAGVEQRPADIGDEALRNELAASLSQAESWGANTEHLADVRAALNKRFASQTPMQNGADKLVHADKMAGVTSNAQNLQNAAAVKPGAVSKPIKKAKTKPEKVEDAGGGSDSAQSAAEKNSEPADASTEAQASGIPARREIRLNQADVEARSDIVAGMLKQISKHIINEPVNVIIQSRSMKDFRWINALLKTSIQELDPQFNLSSEPVVDPAAAPAVILMAR